MGIQLDRSENEFPPWLPGTQSPRSLWERVSNLFGPHCVDSLASQYSPCSFFQKEIWKAASGWLHRDHSVCQYKASWIFLPRFFILPDHGSCRVQQVLYRHLQHVLRFGMCVCGRGRGEGGSGEPRGLLSMSKGLVWRLLVTQGNLGAYSCLPTLTPHRITKVLLTLLPPSTPARSSLTPWGPTSAQAYLCLASLLNEPALSAGPPHVHQGALSKLQSHLNCKANLPIPSKTLK